MIQVAVKAEYTIDLISLCQAAQKSFEQGTTIPDEIIPKSVANLCDVEIKMLDGDNLAKLLVTMPSNISHFISGSLRSDILENNSSTALYLSKMVVEDRYAEEALNCLLEHAKFETINQGKNLACRTLATLYFSGVISKDAIDNEILYHIEAYKRSLALVVGIGVDNRVSSTTKLLLSEHISPDEIHNLVDSITSDPEKLSSTVKNINYILFKIDEGVLTKAIAYDRLLLIHENIRNTLYDNPEEALTIILSAPGLIEELYEELILADQFRGGHAAKWIRAGLKSAYFREDVVGVFTYVAAFSHEGSALRNELFYAISAGEITIKEISDNALSEYGLSILPRFEVEYSKFCNNHDLTNAPSLISLNQSEERTILWLFKPAEEKILSDALNEAVNRIGLNAKYGYDRIKSRVLTSLLTEGDEKYLQWFRVNYPASELTDKSLIKKLWIINEVVKASLPTTALSPKHTKLKHEIAWLASVHSTTKRTT